MAPTLMAGDGREPGLDGFSRLLFKTFRSDYAGTRLKVCEQTGRVTRLNVLAHGEA